MKKAAILSMAAFYLLLTTGTFVCMMHCAAESLLDKTVMQMTHSSDMGHHHKKHCTGGSGCNCCKKHGSYVIKENIKPGCDFQYAQTTISTYHTAVPDYIFRAAVIHNTSWTDSNAPPGKSGKTISIQICSLLI
ncbi:MAG: hypothetical protein M3N14_10590 [Bacteroidota bacterium]|nr:hypothetical protein [Bacteroidota bacterium]